MTNQTRDWRARNQRIADLLMRRTGDDVAAWNARVAAGAFQNEAALRDWLNDQGVTGYPQTLLVMERFGYPDFLVATADELIDAQYRDRPDLRPILDAVLTLAASTGEVTVQARKLFISLLTPRRTFAAVQATTKRRVDLGLRLRDQQPGGRIESPGNMSSGQVTVRIALASVNDVDDEVEDWLRRAYAQNA